GTIDFSNEKRALPETRLLNFNSQGLLTLPPGCYLTTFNEVVHLPTDVMAIGKPRSSLLRMGITIESAVWDAGYNGRGQSLLHVVNPYGVTLSRSARLMQLVFMVLSSETEGYQGVYNQQA